MGIRHFSSSSRSASSRDWPNKEDDDTYNEQEEQRDRPIKLTHVNQNGTAHMVSVWNKGNTRRTAFAVSSIRFSRPEPIMLIKKNAIQKGDVLSTARIAGIMAAKQTANIIPLCHNINISHAEVEAGLIEPPQSSSDAATTTSSQDASSDEANNNTTTEDAFYADDPPDAAQGFSLRRPGSRARLIATSHLTHGDARAVPADVDPAAAYPHGGVLLTARVETVGPTGVEMDALHAASAAALTVFDMCKAVDRAMSVQNSRVVLKTGGRSGDWVDEGWLYAKAGVVLPPLPTTAGSGGEQRFQMNRKVWKKCFWVLTNSGWNKQSAMELLDWIKLRNAGPAAEGEAVGGEEVAGGEDNEGSEGNAGVTESLDEALRPEEETAEEESKERFYKSENDDVEERPEVVTQPPVHDVKDAQKSGRKKQRKSKNTGEETATSPPPSSPPPTQPPATQPPATQPPPTQPPPTQPPPTQSPRTQPPPTQSASTQPASTLSLGETVQILREQWKNANSTDAAGNGQGSTRLTASMIRKMSAQDIFADDVNPRKTNHNVWAAEALKTEVEQQQQHAEQNKKPKVKQKQPEMEQETPEVKQKQPETEQAKPKTEQHEQILEQEEMEDRDKEMEKSGLTSKQARKLQRREKMLERKEEKKRLKAELKAERREEWIRNTEAAKLRREEEAAARAEAAATEEAAAKKVINTRSYATKSRRHSTNPFNHINTRSYATKSRRHSDDPFEHIAIAAALPKRDAARGTGLTLPDIQPTSKEARSAQKSTISAPAPRGDHPLMPYEVRRMERDAVWDKRMERLAALDRLAHQARRSPKFSPHWERARSWGRAAMRTVELAAAIGQHTSPCDVLQWEPPAGAVPATRAGRQALRLSWAAFRKDATPMAWWVQERNFPHRIRERHFLKEEKAGLKRAMGRINYNEWTLLTGIAAKRERRWAVQREKESQERQAAANARALLESDLSGDQWYDKLLEEAERDEEGEMERDEEGEMERDEELEMERDEELEMERDEELEMESDEEGEMEKDEEGKMESDEEGEMEKDEEGKVERNEEDAREPMKIGLPIKEQWYDEVMEEEERRLLHRRMDKKWATREKWEIKNRKKWE